MRKSLLVVIMVASEIFAHDLAPPEIKRITSSDVVELCVVKMDKRRFDELVLPTQEFLVKFKDKYPDFALMESVEFIHMIVPFVINNCLVLPLDLVLLIPIPIVTVPVVMANHGLATFLGLCTSTVCLGANIATFGTGLFLLKKARNFADALRGRSRKDSELAQISLVAKNEELFANDLSFDKDNAQYIFNKYIVLYLFKDFIRRYRNANLVFEANQDGISDDNLGEIFKLLGDSQDVTACLLVSKSWFNAVVKRQSMNLFHEKEFLLKYMNKLSSLNLNELVREIEDNPQLSMLEKDLILIKKRMPKSWRRF